MGGRVVGTPDPYGAVAEHDTDGHLHTWDFPRMAIASEGSTTITSFKDVVRHSCGGIGVADTVIRQGRSTVRRTGEVTATCVDMHNPDDDVWLRCQNEVDALFGEGDSGGPVFTIESDGIWLHGVAWAYVPGCSICTSGSPYYYSPMVNIEFELGMLVAEEDM